MPERGVGGRARRAGSGRVDVARRAAYDVLVTVREQQAYSNLVLPGVLRSRGLHDRDAAFATELVAGTLRRQGLYDAVVAAGADRPLARIDPGVLDALRLGTHQLLAMRVPTHAAVGTTVDLVRAAVGHRPAGFANAVLRTVAGHDLDGWVRRVAPDPATDPIGFAATAHAHPRWVVAELARALGPRADELETLLAADNEAPRVTLAARPGLSTVEELAAAGGERSPSSAYAVRMPGGDPSAVPAVAAGRAGVQDEGSQVVATALAQAGLRGRDERWLDMCAGPGGKTALLAALATGRGARVLAADRAPHRARLVATATRASAGDLLGVVAADGTRPPWLRASFDRVLVDAPCTGLGALRRRPEARWRKSAVDLAGLTPLQEALLDRALDAVRPGGVVAFATCSPVRSETADVVAAVLARRSDTLLEPAAPLVAGFPDAEGPIPGTVQLWPHRHDTDAMFLAVMRRVEP